MHKLKHNQNGAKLAHERKEISFYAFALTEMLQASRGVSMEDQIASLARDLMLS